MLLKVLFFICLLIAALSFQYLLTGDDGPGLYLYFTNIVYAINNAQYEPMQVESLPTVNDPKLKIETIFEGLNSPTSMEFLNNGDILITEKNNGTVQKITNGTILANPILDLHVASRAERGLLGIAVSNERNLVQTPMFPLFRHR